MPSSRSRESSVRSAARAAVRPAVERLEGRSLLSATVTGLQLVDAKTDAVLGAFTGGTIDFTTGKQFNVNATVSADTGSVKFLLDGVFVRTETQAPLSVGGDDGGNFRAWSPLPGSHTLTVIPFSGPENTGDQGAAVSVSFVVVGTAGGAGAGRLGANLNSQSDRVQDLAFVDLVKTTRGFYNVAGRKASNGATDFAKSDVNGWPTEDFSFTAVDDTEWSGVTVEQGTYHMSFKGPSGTKVAAPAGVTVKKLSYDSGTQLNTYDLVVGAGVKALKLTFTATAGQVKNVRLLQPGYALSSTQTFTTRYKNLITTVGPSVLRFMDWTKANGDKEVAWSDRPKTTDATQAKAVVAGDLQPGKGIAWDYVIQLANETNRGVWINVGAHASDAYVTELAKLFLSKLNASLPIYVEHSNEVWNAGFEQYGYNKSQATAEVGANPSSNLVYDGATNADVIAQRRHARRTKQIADIFKSVWQAAGKSNPLNGRVRVVLGGQASKLSLFDNELAYLNAVYGSPKAYLWGIGIAPYFNLGGLQNNTSASKDQLLAAFTSSVNAYVNGSTLSTAFSQAAKYGVKLLGYEGGPDTYGAANVANKRLASIDPQIQAIIVRYLNNWYAKGGDLFNYYTVGARSYNSPYGTWSITESYSNLTSAKIKAFQQVRG
ncbi:MAG TPA: hypothetical protein VF796_16900 [Humisphaera sp.]